MAAIVHLSRKADVWVICWFLLQSHVVKGRAWYGTLTWHSKVSGLVVWVPIRDGLGQVVNGHFIFLARFYHKVAKGKMPLKKREEWEVGQVTHHISHIAMPKEPHPTHPQKFSEEIRITITRSKIRGFSIFALRLLWSFLPISKNLRPGLINIVSYTRESRESPPPTSALPKYRTMVSQASSGLLKSWHTRGG